MPFVLFMTDHNHSVNPVGEPVATKEDAARLVRDALQATGVPLAGIAWRPIADGLMRTPTGEAVLGVHGYHFLIEEVTVALAMVEPPASYVPSGTCQYPPGCDAPAMPGFRACQPHYILVGALLGNPDGPAPTDEAIAWANRVTHTTTV